MDEHDVYWEPYGIKLSNHTDKAIELRKLKGIYSSFYFEVQVGQVFLR